MSIKSVNVERNETGPGVQQLAAQTLYTLGEQAAGFPVLYIQCTKTEATGSFGISKGQLKLQRHPLEQIPCLVFAYL